MIPAVETDSYRVTTLTDEKKILLSLVFVDNGDDAGRMSVRHAVTSVFFEHKKSKDKLVFRLTNKGCFYRKGPYQVKEERINERECLEEFSRLLNPEQGADLMKLAKVRLALGV